MAYVKIQFIRHAKNVLNYIQREKGPNDLVDAADCIPQNAANDFERIRNLHRGKGEIQAVHIIQSWSEKDSQKYPAQKFEAMGKELVQAHFPGHAYVIATHTQTGKTHNHIVVNPWHSETGKKIENKKHHLYDLRERSNEISLRNGLSIIEPKGRHREANLPDKVQRIVRFNGRSYLMDLMQKADFARAYATNYDEFVSTLNEFNIQAKVQNKNITYFYPGKERGKRGSKLGRIYDKPGLTEAFGINAEKFRQYPELHADLKSKIDTVKLNPATLSNVGRELSFPATRTMDWIQNEARNRRKQTPAVAPSESELASSPLHIMEIAHAKRQSIFEYAKRNKIALEQSPEGHFTLKGRPYVRIEENRWFNKKNRTEGNLIDFVAAHKNISFLKAVAEINQDTRLALLEQQFGEQKRTFTSFYIPQPEQMDRSRAMGQVAYFLRGFGIPEKQADSLLGSGQLQISNSGRIRLFPEDDFSGGLEFHRDGQGDWNRKKLGEIRSPFGTTHRLKDSLIIFTDPITLLKNGGLFEFSKKNSHASVLALFEPNPSLVNSFLERHPTVKDVSFVGADKRKRSKDELDFFGFLQRKYPGISLGPYAPGRERGKGLEIPFP